MSVFAPIALMLLAGPNPQGFTPQALERIGRMQEAELRALCAWLEAQRMPEANGVYQRAYVRWSLARLLGERAPKEAEALLDQAVRLLESRKEGEHQALLGQIHLEQMGQGGFATRMRLGGRTQTLFELARQGQPQSPRVWVFQGKFALGMPAFLGGGPAKAIPILETAVHLAEREGRGVDPWAPAWGRCEAQAWLAWAYAKAGRWTEAEACARRALVLDPGYAFVRDHVLPFISRRGNR